MAEIKAFLFDLNGTMIDDMAFHIRAWHAILNSLGAELSLERTRMECYGKNDELLERIFPGRFSVEEKTAMSIEKERQYQEAFRPLLRLIDGLPEFLERAHSRQIRMAIGSAAIMFNIDFVVDGLDLRKYFEVIISADHVSESKPHPETYLKCAELLGVAPEACVVFEDSPKGIEAADRAGMKSVAITTMHEAAEFDAGSDILFFIKDFTDPQLERLFNN